jgi:hypothetical protein
MPNIARRATTNRIVRAKALHEGVARGGKLPVALVHQVGSQHEHDRSLPPPPVRVLGKSLPLRLRQRAPEPGLDPGEETPAQELPGEVAGEGGHRDAVTPGHDGGGLLERDQVARTPVAVRYQDVPEPGAAQGRAVVHHRIADHPLAHGHRAH